MKKSLDKITIAIILYFIEKLNGILGKTSLQKILFLLNLRSEKRFNKSLAKLEFEKNKYGPYSYEVNDYIEELLNKNAISIESFSYTDKNGKQKEYTRYYFKNTASPKEFLMEKLNPKEMVLLGNVAESYGNLSLRDLLDIVYSLPTIKEAKYRHPLKMAKIIESEEVTNDQNFEDLF